MAELREDYIIPSVFNRDVADSGRRRGGRRRPKRQGTAEAGAGAIGYAAEDAEKRSCAPGDEPACRTRPYPPHDRA